MTAEASSDLQRAALEWQAEEHAAKARTDARVAALGEATAAPAAPQTPDDAQAAQVAAAAEAALPQVCGLAWKLLDRGIQGFLGPHCAASPEELQQLAALTVPVVQKYLPKDLTGFFSTPEGALAFGVVTVYGLKSLAGAPVPPEAPAAPPAAPVAPSPAPEAAS